MSTRKFQVVTDRGRSITILEIQTWIDTSDKSGSSRVERPKELRLVDGTRLAFDGDRFSLPNGESFGLADIPSR